MKLSAKNSLVRQAAQRREVPARRVDHRRRAARVHLVAGQVAEIVQHGLVHEPRSAGPHVGCRRFGQHRDEREIRVLRLPFAADERKVQVALRARAPVQHDLARHAVMQHVLDHRLDRGKPGPAGDEDHRLVAVLAQVERAERTFEAENFAALERREQRIGEQPARRVPDVQLDELVGMRRRGDREAAPVPVLQQEIDVLAGQVLQPLARRQLELDDGDVGHGLVDRFDPARQPLDLDVPGTTHLAHLDDEIRARTGDAKQRDPAALLVVGQRRWLVRAEVDAAVENPPLARAARTVAAAVRDHQVGAHRGLQHRFVRLAAERMIARPYANLHRHRRSSFKYAFPRRPS